MKLDVPTPDYNILKALADTNYRTPVDQLRYMLAKQHELDDSLPKPVMAPVKVNPVVKAKSYPRFNNVGTLESKVLLAVLELGTTFCIPASPQTVNKADPSITTKQASSVLSALVNHGALARVPHKSPAIYELTPRGTKSAAKLYEMWQKLQPKD